MLSCNPLLISLLIGNLSILLLLGSPMGILLIVAIIYCTLHGLVLSLLPVEAVVLDLLKMLARDTHVIRLRLVGHLDQLSLFPFALILARLYQGLVAKRALDAVFGRVRHRWQVVVARLNLQLRHRPLQLRVNPLPQALVMEEVLALGADYRLFILELFAADDTCVSFFSLLASLLVDLIRDVAE